MKTFDEAFAAVMMRGVQQPDSILQDLRTGSRISDNRSWSALVERFAEEICAETSAANTPLMAKAVICSQLHIMFDIGVLVGMEMEKEGLPA